MRSWAGFFGCFVAVLGCLGETWAVMVFCRRFLSEKNPIFGGKLFFPAFAVGRLALILLNKSVSLPYILLAFANHVLLLGLVTVLFPENPAKKLFAASLLTMVITLLGDFFSSVFPLCGLVFLHVVRGIPEPFLADWPNVLISGISVLGIIGTICLLSAHAGPVFHGKQTRWYLAASVPLLMVTVLIDVADWCASNGILLRGQGDLYQAQLFSHGEICVLTALSLTGAGVCVLGMHRTYEEQQRSGRYHCRLAAYQMLTDQYRQMERLRHDLKNHVIALQGLLREGDAKAMEAYLKAMEEKGGLRAGGEASGSPVVDSLLWRKKEQAEELHIRWECSVSLPKDCRIREFDLCVLFGNLLDNALEACEGISEEGGRFLRLQAGMVRQCFLLEMKNSVGRRDGDEERSRKTGRKSGRHGIGLQNVRDIVETYQGTMELEESEGVFTSLLLLPVNPAETVHIRHETGHL